MVFFARKQYWQVRKGGVYFIKKQKEFYMELESAYKMTMHLISELNPSEKRVVEGVLHKVKESKVVNQTFRHDQSTKTCSDKKHLIHVSHITLNDENNYLSIMITDKKTFDSMEIKLYNMPYRYHEMETDAQKQNFDTHLFGSRIIEDTNSVKSYKIAEIKKDNFMHPGKVKDYKIYSIGLDLKNPQAYVIDALTSETVKAEPMDYAFGLTKEK